MQGLFMHRCTIERKPDESQVAASSGGDVMPIYEVVSDSAVPCLVQPRSGDYRQQEHGKSQSVTHRIFFPRNVDVRVGDRVILGSARFELTFIADQMSRHYEADAVLIGNQ